MKVEGRRWDATRTADGDSAPKLVGNNVLYSSWDQALWIAQPLSCAADAVGSAS